jgi:hypothetical protein
MNGWQKIGVGISVLWMIGLPIFFIVRSGNLKTVGHALIAGNSDTAALWTMMLGPVVLLCSYNTSRTSKFGSIASAPSICITGANKPSSIEARASGLIPVEKKLENATMINAATSSPAPQQL